MPATYILINADNEARAFCDWDEFAEFLVERHGSGELINGEAIDLQAPSRYVRYDAQAWANELVEQDRQQREHEAFERAVVRAA